MPRVSLSRRDALNAAIVASNLVQELSDAFPPAKAAAASVLLILETVKNVQTNQADCQRLARRCLDLLVHIKDQVDEPEKTPPSLHKNIEKFENTLNTIQFQMQEFTEKTWRSRLFNKGGIERVLGELNAELDDAARSFQISTLIDIHYAVGKRSTQSSIASGSLSRPDPSASIDSARRQRDKPTNTISHDIFSAHSLQGISETEEREVIPRTESPVSMSPLVGKFNEVDIYEYQEDINSDSEEEYVLVSPNSGQPSTNLSGWSTMSSINGEFSGLSHSGGPSASTRESACGSTDIEHHRTDQFREYHQSEVRLQGRSKIKDGWWAGAVQTTVDGEAALVKRYERGSREECLKDWKRDVDVLKSVQHPNIPYLLGYSDSNSPTPFIVLRNANTRALRVALKDELARRTTEECNEMLVRLFNELLDAASQLQATLDLTESKAQDYVENASYRVDETMKVIMGLPPRSVDEVVSVRTWTLKGSVRDVFLQALPTAGTAQKEQGEVEGKVAELKKSFAGYVRSIQTTAYQEN
ncbi:hypothetical protein K474DRAFT_1713251 [Panus rudis PR-1116 ss-1]|nr:hypothetical protein K474DRAFT_1713251 [Panus rudis PR-1116 ss-1]